MQKRWLKDFEYYINPTTWSVAQDLVQEGGVKSLREVEKHFWVALVEDHDAQYEVEIVLTPHKIKAYTCECWGSAGRRLMCAHVAAALLKIRHFLQRNVEERAEKQEKKSGAGLVLSLRNVVEQADADALAKFVVEYARGDRDFALALKTWFAGRSSANENLYLHVLDAAIPRMAMSRPLRNPELRRLRKTLDTLQVQFDHAIAEGNYQLAFQIVEAVMQRIPPLLGRMEESIAGQIGHFTEYTVQQMLLWPAVRLSPELNNQRRDALTDWYLKPGFPSGIKRETVSFLASFATEQGYYQQLRNHFDRQGDQPNVMRLFLAALAQRDMPEAVVRVLDGSTLSPADLASTLRFLQQAGFTAAAGQGAAHFLKNLPLSQNHRRELEDILLALAESDSDHEMLTQIFSDRYLQHPAPDNLQRVKKAVQEQEWPTVRQQLIERLRVSNKRGALLNLLSGEDLSDELAKELMLETDLELLQRYEDRLLPEYHQLFRERYAELFDEHLKEHFGRQASLYVREVVGNLLDRRHTALAVDLVRDLVQRYPDRSTLSEELIDLFPKTQRKTLFDSTSETLKP